MLYFFIHTGPVHCAIWCLETHLQIYEDALMDTKILLIVRYYLWKSKNEVFVYCKAVRCLTSRQFQPKVSDDR